MLKTIVNHENWKNYFAVIILAVIVVVGIAATSSVLIIAEDESEGGVFPVLTWGQHGI